MTARTIRSRLGVSIGLLAATVTIIGMLGAVPAIAGGHHHHHHHGPVDSDHDGMPNRWEQSHGLAAHHRNAQKDPDKDGLRNIAEYKHTTRPHVADTDKDGLEDGAEVHQFETNPKNDDSDHDGIEDGDDDGNDDGVADEGEDGDHEGFVGTVMTFNPTTGVLVFESTIGLPVAGVVTADTELEFGGDCDGEASTNALVPGQDLFEVRFFAFGPHDEFPEFRSIEMDCPPPED